MMLGKYRIGDVHNHGVVDLTHLLSYSSNVGAAKLGLDMTSEHLYDVLHRFGYGSSARSVSSASSHVVPNVPSNPSSRAAS